MSWLVVTPARNEALRLPVAARHLAAQRAGLVGLWVVVDDGSSDGTAESVPDGLPFPVEVLRRDNSGGLTGASDLAAFLAGADAGLRRLANPERVMKLDADVRLAPDYLDHLVDVPPEVGLVAGRIEEPGQATRADYTRGPVKAYTPAGLELLRSLPVALGWDVMDEVCLRRAGLDTLVVPEAIADVLRTTGSSEGVLRGRRRAGVVSRWTGYHPAYLLMRLMRYSVRRPFLVGAAVMLHAWATAGPGPFPVELRRAHRSEQISRMRVALRRAVPPRRARRTPAS